MRLELAKVMAQDLLRYHGLAALGWRFRWDRAVRRVGNCSYTRKTISVSQRLAEINSSDLVLDVILHEIAHAFTKHDRGHGHEWKIVARQLGAKPERCSSLKDIVQVAQPFTGTCSDCGVVMHRPRRPQPQMIRGAIHTPCQWKPKRGRVQWAHHGQPLTA